MFKFGFKASKYKINCEAQGTDLKIELLWFDYPSVIYSEMESAEVLEVKNTHMHNHN